MAYSRGTDQVKQDPRGISLSGVTESLRVKLLGGFVVSVEARAIEGRQWRLRKAASLLKVLALAPRHRLAKEQVMDLFWPKLEPAAAANNLRYALYVVRRTLDPTSATAASRYLHFQDSVLELCPSSPLWVDVVTFEEAAVAAF